MPTPIPLQPEQYYHLYNRGNNRVTIFFEERNYRYFLQLYAKHAEPVVDTYAYCLMPNHFHFLVRVKTESEIGPVSETGPISNPSRRFNNLFIAYAKAINKAYGRTGALFERPFKRILVDTDRYLAALIAYIHQNPQRHGLVDDYRAWTYSSYHALVSDKPTRLKREEVLEWFDGRAGLEAFHCQTIGERQVAPLLGDDFD